MHIRHTFFSLKWFFFLHDSHQSRGDVTLPPPQPQTGVNHPLAHSLTHPLTHSLAPSLQLTDTLLPLPFCQPDTLPVSAAPPSKDIGAASRWSSLCKWVLLCIPSGRTFNSFNLIKLPFIFSVFPPLSAAAFCSKCSHNSLSLINHLPDFLFCSGFWMSWSLKVTFFSALHEEVEVKLLSWSSSNPPNGCSVPEGRQCTHSTQTPSKVTLSAAQNLKHSLNF